MEKKNIAIISLGVVVILFLGLLMFNPFEKNATTNLVKYESKQLKAFNADFQKQVEKVNSSNMSNEEGAYFLNSWINDNSASYNSDSVDLAAFELQSMLNGNFDSLSNLVDSVGEKINNFDVSKLLEGLLNKEAVKTVTMKSNTVCQVVTDSKYCVAKLSANVYINDVNSDKWVVLVHPFMTSGSLIYNSIGGMYEEQGYNIIAPDLRGFGNSDGSVAMGYLESLDIYDWIKDLNINWGNASRYGVNVAPTTIVVHGISLGGATTLQLATNPDIAAANGSEPYTKTLTQLNIKGFVDDCGYTSMSGIITGMLGGGSATNLSSLLGSFGVSEVDFMAELQKQFTQVGVTGFNFDFNKLTNGDISDKLNMFNDFSEQYNYLNDALSGNITVPGNPSTSNPYFNGTFDLGQLDLNELKDKYGDSYQIPSADDYNKYLNEAKDYLDNYKNSGTGKLFFQSNLNSNVSVMQVNNSFANIGNSDFIDGLVGTALMKLVGVGLTEDNYAKYSDVFSAGRKFPTGTKVAVIHGNADTTVPFSNANIVASNAAPATLLKKWEVNGAPHAFVVVGMKKDEYLDFVTKFTDCVENASCTTIN